MAIRDVHDAVLVLDLRLQNGLADSVRGAI